MHVRAPLYIHAHGQNFVQPSLPIFSVFFFFSFFLFFFFFFLFFSLFFFSKLRTYSISSTSQLLCNRYPLNSFTRAKTHLLRVFPTSQAHMLRANTEISSKKCKETSSHLFFKNYWKHKSHTHWPLFPSSINISLQLCINTPVQIFNLRKEKK